MLLPNPVPAFSFSVLLLEAKPGSSSTPNFSATVADPSAPGIRASFSEITGLNAGMETEEYREGGYNTAARKFIKWGKFPNVVLKRGVTTNSDLWDWYYATLYGSANPIRMNALIILNDRGIADANAGSDRAPVAVWFVRNALPETLQGPTLNAKSNEIAIETLELVHEGAYRLSSSIVASAGAPSAATSL